MIAEFKEENIYDICLAQMNAWKEAFKGILSGQLLSSLSIEEFSNNWKEILKQKDRSNYIWLNDTGKALGFVSFGKPKSEKEIADFEIYGLYVHPDHWGKTIGTQLMKFTIDKITKLNPSVKIILWTMRENKLSCNFYRRLGFIEADKYRISKRSEERFEEVQFEMDIHTFN